MGGKLQLAWTSEVAAMVPPFSRFFFSKPLVIHINHSCTKTNKPYPLSDTDSEAIL